MSSVSNLPYKYARNPRYIGSIMANDYWISNNCPRTFVKGKLESVPARPVQYFSFVNRILQAYDVLIGKADALYWWETFVCEEDRLEPTYPCDIVRRLGDTENCVCGVCKKNKRSDGLTQEDLDKQKKYNEELKKQKNN